MPLSRVIPYTLGYWNYIILRNNTLENNHIYEATIMIQTSSGNNLTGNIVENFTNGNAVTVGDEPFFNYGNNLINNTVIDSYLGITLYGDHNTLIANNLTNNIFGILVGYNLDTTLENNILYNNSKYGIFIINSTDVNMTGNQVTKNNIAGIQMNNTLDVIMDGNNVSDNVWAGILLYNVSNGSLFNNEVCFNYGDDILDLDNNTGILNRCDTGNWSDGNITGCTYQCTRILLTKTANNTDTFPDHTINWTIYVENEGLRNVSVAINDTFNQSYDVINLSAGANFTASYTTLTVCHDANNTAVANATNVFTSYTTSVLESVNVVTCGDGVCNCGEECGTCSEDCGNCDTGTPPGGTTVIITPPTEPELPDDTPDDTAGRDSDTYVIPDLKELEIISDDTFSMGDLLEVIIIDDAGNPVLANVILTRPDGSTVIISSDEKFIIDQNGVWKITVEKEGYTPTEKGIMVIEKEAPRDLGTQIAKTIDDIADFFLGDPVRFTLLLATVVLLVGGFFYHKKHKKKELESF